MVDRYAADMQDQRAFEARHPARKGQVSENNSRTNR
jgi:hypothetical protein